MRAPPSYSFPSQSPVIRPTSKPSSQSDSFIQDAGLIPWLRLFPWPSPHPNTYAQNLSSSEKSSYSCPPLKSRKRVTNALYLLSSKLHWPVVFRIKRNILSILMGFPFLPLSNSALCDTLISVRDLCVSHSICFSLFNKRPMKLLLAGPHCHCAAVGASREKLQ